MSGEDALAELLGLLKAADYRFTAVTPATHARVLARPCMKPDLRDIFGWSRRFRETDLPARLLDCLARASMVESTAAGLRSAIRVASLGEDLFVHSAYPTVASDAVFFGPDTYRFVHFVQEQLPRLRAPPRWIIDMGAGSGAGAICAARLAPRARMTAIDVNPQALRFTSVNARVAAVPLEASNSSELPRGADLVIANPPYIMDAAQRTYRDGGELLGGQLAADWTQQALDGLADGGTMLLYAGASVVEGSAPLIEALHAACADSGAEIHLAEIDPDVFGEELEQPVYTEVERIALICATIRKP